MSLRLQNLELSAFLHKVVGIRAECGGTLRVDAGGHEFRAIHDNKDISCLQRNKIFKKQNKTSNKNRLLEILEFRRDSNTAAYAFSFTCNLHIN